jgi:4-amino-4-deoxy-L-arabinose transferase-like glycosyltransferase
MKTVWNLLKNPLLWIFLLALILRTYKLGEFPYGFHVDEARVAWNALSIFKTGHDDQNKILSLYYNSFGDYRPSGIFYFTVPFIAIFGRCEFATRLPVALMGALTVIPIYFLVETVNKNRKLRFKNINTGHLAAFLLAISPWHIDLSRATNEVVISTFFALCALLFFIKLIKSQKYNFGVFSTICIILSYLFYHAIRFLAPPFFIIAFLYYLKGIKKRQVRLWVWICLISTFLLTIFFSTTKEGMARFDQVSIFKDVDTTYQIQRIRSENLNSNPLTMLFDNKFVIYFKTFMDQYSRYFAGDFLIGSEARPYRFATPGVGLITYVEAILLIIGGVEVLKGRKNLLPLLLLFVAPLAAAITAEDSPNLSRAFLMLPFIILLEACGLETILLFSKKYKRQILVTAFLLLALNFLYFSYMYLNHSINHRPFLENFFVDSPTYRNVGAKELTLKLDSLKTKYDKIIITNFPDNPYPWYAFFTNKNPAEFNKNYSETTSERDYENIIFSQDKCPSDYALVKYSKKNILIVDSWECPFESQINDNYPLKIVGEIKRPDGSVVYTFLERDWSKPLFVDGVYY